MADNRPESYQTPNIHTLCNCTLIPTHLTGEQLLSCAHGHWLVKARQVTQYDFESYTGTEAQIQQAAMASRAVNGELSGF